MYSNMLELAISMIFLYLMLSAACSAIQEIIANTFRWRAKTLEKGIAGLLDQGFKEDLYKSPLISGLCSPNAFGKLTRRPSYIPSATFALAVVHLAAEKGIDLSSTPVASPPGVVTRPPASVDPSTRVLQSLLLGTNSIDDQKKIIEDWFNGSMDRISGWYKRKVNLVLWIISVVLCIFVNADSISLANAFWNDPTMRAAITAAATEKVREKASTPSTAPANPAASGGALASTGSNLARPTTQTPPPARNAAAGGGTSTGSNATGTQPVTDDDSFRRLDKVRQELAEVNIPLGWCHVARREPKAPLKCWPDFERAQQSANDKGSSSPVPSASSNGTTDSSSSGRTRPVNDPRLRMALTWKNWSWWLLKLFGITVTALAISQGAPFWFDVLQKAVNLRLAGAAPDEKEQKRK